MPGTTYRHQGERIRAARKAAGLSQAELARALSHLTRRKIDKALVSQWETYRIKNPENLGLIALEAVTGFRLHWIVTGKAPEKVGEGAVPVLTGPAPMDPRLLEQAIRVAATALGAMANPERVASIAAGLYELLVTTPELTEPALLRMARMLATTGPAEAPA